MSPPCFLIGFVRESGMVELAWLWLRWQPDSTLSACARHLDLLDLPQGWLEPVEETFNSNPRHLGDGVAIRLPQPG
jgi:hypothetical protein